MPEITAEDVSRVARDALYVGIGLSVIAFQKAQVRRVELTEILKGQVGEANDQLDKLGANAEDVIEGLKARVETVAGSVDDRVKLVEDRLDAVEGRFEALFDEVEAKLPEPAREIVSQARDTARDARQQVRAAVSRAA